jgi:hypothetical protein
LIEEIDVSITITNNYERLNIDTFITKKNKKKMKEENSKREEKGE